VPHLDALWQLAAAGWLDELSGVHERRESLAVRVVQKATPL
jgi:hypothetical protein